MVIFRIYVSLQDGMMYIPCWVLSKTRWRVPTSVDGSLLNHNWGFIRAKHLQQWCMYIYIYWLVVLTILKNMSSSMGFGWHPIYVWDVARHGPMVWHTGYSKRFPKWLAKAVTSVWPWYLWLFNIQKVEKLPMKSDNFWWFTWFTYQTWWFS
jgi:hypothetical protein